MKFHALLSMKIFFLTSSYNLENWNFECSKFNRTNLISTLQLDAKLMAYAKFTSLVDYMTIIYKFSIEG